MKECIFQYHQGRNRLYRPKNRIQPWKRVSHSFNYILWGEVDRPRSVQLTRPIWLLQVSPKDRPDSQSNREIKAAMRLSRSKILRPIHLCYPNCRIRQASPIRAWSCRSHLMKSRRLVSLHWVSRMVKVSRSTLTIRHSSKALTSSSFSRTWKTLSKANNQTQ